MATTTNFGWETPDDTDLVKDGALAMRTLGNSIDTSFVDLKGGTTGQILSKASNTDLDYTWITNDVGDITGVTAGTGLTGGGTSGAVTVNFDVANFGGGQNAAGKNVILNGAFDIWQRGTSNAITTTAYVADRFCAYRAVAGSTVSRQATNDTTNLPFIQYCARVQRDSGNTSTSLILFGQPVESINSIPFAGKTVTFSFYARAGANYSAASSALAVYLNTGTGTDQNVITGSYTGNAQPINQTATLTTTWQRFSYTATLATTATELSVFYGFTPVGTAGAADYFEVTGLQLELGSTATPFQRTTGSASNELSECQRYFYRHASGDAKFIGMAAAYSASWAQGGVSFPTTMRTTPTLSTAAGTDYYTFYRNSGNDPFNSAGINQGNTTCCSLYNNSEISSTAGHAGWFITNNASATVDFSSEL